MTRPAEEVAAELRSLNSFYVSGEQVGELARQLLPGETVADAIASGWAVQAWASKSSALVACTTARVICVSEVRTSFLDKAMNTDWFKKYTEISFTQMHWNDIVEVKTEFDRGGLIDPPRTRLLISGYGRTSSIYVTFQFRRGEGGSPVSEAEVQAFADRVQRRVAVAKAGGSAEVTEPPTPPTPPPAPSSAWVRRTRTPRRAQGGADRRGVRCRQAEAAGPLIRSRHGVPLRVALPPAGRMAAPRPCSDGVSARRVGRLHRRSGMRTRLLKT